MRRITALLITAALAAAPAAGLAKDRDDDDDRGHGRGKGHSNYRYEYDDGDCRYKYKSTPGVTKEEVKCRDRAGYRGPPPWVAMTPQYYPQPQRYVPPFGLDGGTCNRELIGGLIGGAVGGVTGAQIGKGTGRTVATAAGTLAGFMLGASVGRGMDQIDARCMGQVLEYAPPQQAVAWDNPDARAQYQVVPLSTYEDGGGRYCREYQTSVVIDGRRQQAHGTACRAPDGSWQVVN